MSLIYVLDHALCLPNAVCLQALLCVEGRKALYSYCREHEIPFKQLGKLIVATDARQIPSLESILSRGRANGIADLRSLSKEEVSELEPNIKCVKAILSPSTGIIDSHSFMQSLRVLTYLLLFM